MNKRAAIYLRVSRSDQSSDLQADETLSLLTARAWSCSTRFTDDGISGSHGNRPGFRAMMKAARRRAFDVLVVWRSDRLFRSLTELVTTIDELAALGIGFVSVTEPFDTTTPPGRLLLQVCGAFAEFERNVLRERTRSGLAAARARGAKLGRPRRAVDLDRVRQLRELGMSTAAIATELGISEATLYRTLSKTCPEPPAQVAETV